MGATNEHRETIRLCAGVLKQMSNISSGRELGTAAALKSALFFFSVASAAAARTRNSLTSESLELPVHLGSTGVCYSTTQHCCQLIGEDWCKFSWFQMISAKYRNSKSILSFRNRAAEPTACLPVILYSSLTKRWVDVLLIPCHVMDVFTQWFIYMYDFTITWQCSCSILISHSALELLKKMSNLEYLKTFLELFSFLSSHVLHVHIRKIQMNI